MVFQKGLCELRVRLCTQLNPTFDCWIHSFPFPPKSMWKQQNRKKWLSWNYFELFSIPTPKMKTSFPICTRCSLGDKMKHLNPLVRKDQGNEGLGSQICCQISCTGLSTSSITGAHPIMSKSEFLPLLLGLEVRLFWRSSAEHALTRVL